MLRMELDGAVAVVTIDRPPANAIDHQMLLELAALLPELQAAPVQAVVLTGSGRFFSAGLDLFAVFAYEEEQARAFATVFDEVVTGLLALEAPLVAAINGHAVAGGAVLAATADFRLMGEGAGQVGLTEIRVGVPFPTSALEAVRLSCAGPHLAELLYRGLTYPAEGALQRRLVDEIVPAAELLQRARALAQELGAHDRTAFLSTKRALRAESLARVGAARASGEDPVWSHWRTPETRARMEAYRARLERR